MLEQSKTVPENMISKDKIEYPFDYSFDIAFISPNSFEFEIELNLSEFLEENNITL